MTFGQKIWSFGCAIALTANAASASDWRYFGTYADSYNKAYMAFYEGSSVKRKVADEVSTAVRFVWSRDLNAYWRKHGSDSDIIESGAERFANDDFPAYFELPAVVQSTQEEVLRERAIVAMGNEFILNSNRVQVKRDAIWSIDCKNRVFSVLGLPLTKEADGLANLQRQGRAKYAKIVAQTEADYLQQLLCRRNS